MLSKYPFICIKKIGHYLLTNLAFALIPAIVNFSSEKFQDLPGIHRVQTMQVVNTKPSWPFRVHEGEPRGGGSAGWLTFWLPWLRTVCEFICIRFLSSPWGTRKHAQGLLSLTVIISARVSGTGVEFDTKENNFSLEKERLDDSCFQISEEPSCGRKHKLDLCDAKGKN